ncbi:Maf family protein [Bacillus pacificus]
MGFKVKDLFFVQHIQGDYYSVVGLPISRLVRELKQFNIDVTPCVKLHGIFFERTNKGVEK